MAYAIKKFTEIISDMITWMVANQSKLTDFNEGSIIRTFLETVALEIEQVYIRTRIGFGEELKNVPYYSFNFTKQLSQKAAGTVVFGRAGTVGTATIPTGTLVATADGIQFITTAAGSIPNGNTTSAAVAIQAVIAGNDGNVLANTIVLIISSLVGVDTVINSASTTGGLDEESDTSLLLRFQQFIEGLGKSNVSGLITGAKSVAGVRSASVVEHFPPVSNYNITVYIDDGAGNAPAAMLADVESVLIGDGTPANPGYKAAGVNLRVLAPTKVTISVDVEIVSDGTTSQDVIEYQVINAIMDYINNLLLGEDVIRNRLIDTIMDIRGVTDLTLTTPAGNTTIGSTQIARIASTDIVVTFAT